MAYLLTLPLAQIQTAPDDRVATAMLSAIFGSAGAGHHGRRHHDLDLRLRQWPDSGRRARLLRHGSRRTLLPFDRPAERTPRARRKGLVLQGLWAALLVLARTRLVDPATGAVTYGNLYSDLLDYVVFAALIFYVLTILRRFCAAAETAGRRAAVSRFWLSRDPGVVYRRGCGHHGGV